MARGVWVMVLKAVIPFLFIFVEKRKMKSPGYAEGLDRRPSDMPLEVALVTPDHFR